MPVERCRAVGALIGFALLALAGCSPPPRVAKDNFQQFGTLFAVYADASAKLGRPPRSLDELKPLLAKNNAGEEIFTSPRDGQPLTIVWGVDLQDRQNLQPPAVIAYEQQGSQGERLVLTVMGVRPVSDEEFAKLKLPATSGS